MMMKAKHIRRQIGMTAAILFGAVLLLIVGFAPQEAQAQEMKATQEGQQSAGGQQPSQKKHQFDKDPKGNEVASGELIVSYKKGSSKGAKDEASKQAGGQVEKDFSEIEVQLLSFPEIKNERAQEARQQALERKKETLEKNPNVEAAEYNHVLEPSFTPNDPDYGNQWDYPKIKAPEAWDSTQGSSSVKVAVIDTGIDPNHPDLQGKLVAQYDFAHNDSTAEDTTEEHPGHGTHVAGTIAATTNNGTGVAGTCPNCKLLMAKYWAEDSGGTTDTVLSSLDWAVSQGANVINMSLGNSTYSTALEQAVNYAWNRGIVLVAASGNGGTDGPEFYPAAYQNVVAVAATNQDDNRRPTSNAGDWVDVAAPGGDIYSTVPTDQGSYAFKSGTSMATPHVSGLAGLLFSKGFISNVQVRNRIESTALDLGPAGKDPEYGSGRVNAQAAVGFTPVTYQENSSSITYTNPNWFLPWIRSCMSGASGGCVEQTSSSNARAKLSFAGNSVSWWAIKNSNNGRANVYVDGSYAGTIDLYSATSSVRPRAVFTKSWATSGQHTLEIRVQGTSGRPNVDIDAFTVLKPAAA